MNESNEFRFEIEGTIRARNRDEAWIRVRRVLEAAGFYDIGGDTLALAQPEWRDADGLGLAEYGLRIDGAWIQEPVEHPGDGAT